MAIIYNCPTVYIPLGERLTCPTVYYGRGGKTEFELQMDSSRSQTFLYESLMVTIDNCLAVVDTRVPLPLPILIGQ